MSTFTTEYHPISDLGDEFCTHPRPAIRRLLDLSQDGTDDTEEEAADAENQSPQR
jgi:hypothetical protein